MDADDWRHVARSLAMQVESLHFRLFAAEEAAALREEEQAMSISYDERTRRAWVAARAITNDLNKMREAGSIDALRAQLKAAEDLLGLIYAQGFNGEEAWTALEQWHEARANGGAAAD